MKKNTIIAALLATSVIFAGSVAFAQGNNDGQDSGRRGGHFFIKAADTDNDGKVSKEEMTAYKEAQFKKYDTNNDGELSQDELSAMQDARKAGRQAAMFERLDTDKNGSLSQEELSNGHEGGPRGGYGHKGGNGHKGGWGHKGGKYRG